MMRVTMLCDRCGHAEPSLDIATEDIPEMLTVLAVYAADNASSGLCGTCNRTIDGKDGGVPT